MQFIDRSKEFTTAVLISNLASLSLNATCKVLRKYLATGKWFKTSHVQQTLLFVDTSKHHIKKTRNGMGHEIFVNSFKRL
jgi:hypothetical protein